MRTGQLAASILFLCACASATACGSNSPGGGRGDDESGDESGDESTGQGSDNPYLDYQSELYGGTDNWLCHPDLDVAGDTCRTSLSTTVVQADGSTSVIDHLASADAAFDCFYVYPTASADPQPNSDLEPGDEESWMTLIQAARYQQVCRTFAPVYRQVTTGALFNPSLNADWELAYGDVLDAFRSYVGHNDGRGFLLIGHSQGTSHLRELIAQEIEGNAYLESHLVGAHLIGNTIEVPVDGLVGGSFASTPLCTTRAQAGCVVSYASYRAEVPPDPATARFGLAQGVGMEAACNPPSALAGGKAGLTGDYPLEFAGVFGSILSDDPGPFADPSAHGPIESTFYRTPGLVEGECVKQDGLHYLQISVNADPLDPRADEIGGDFATGWGLHLADITMAMDDLVLMAGEQGSAWLAAR